MNTLITVMKKDGDAIYNHLFSQAKKYILTNIGQTNGVSHIEMRNEIRIYYYPQSCVIALEYISVSYETLINI